MVNYEGIFFEGESADIIRSLDIKELPITNDLFHCTFKYRPRDDEIFDEIVGMEIEVLIIGYGNDGHNSGFAVQLPNDITKYYINYDEKDNKLKIPHITASLAKGAKAVNTKNLTFVPLKKPIKIKGRFGYWIIEGNRQYVSYDKYKNNRTIK